MSNLSNTAPGFNELCGHPRFRYLIERLHDQGPRPLGELLARFVRKHPEVYGGLIDLLEDYATTDADYLRRMGFDQWHPQVTLVPESVMRNGIATGTATAQTVLSKSLAPRRPGPDGGQAA
jgi:hypothetical protein